MKISMDKEYTTESGLEVKLYSVERNKGGWIHGAVRDKEGDWVMFNWCSDGRQSDKGATLVEKPPFNLDDIPWDALKDDIQWVAMDELGDKHWGFYTDKPYLVEGEGYWDIDNSRNHMKSPAIKMPIVPTRYWEETLVERPKC